MCSVLEMTWISSEVGLGLLRKLFSSATLIGVSMLVRFLRRRDNTLSMQDTCCNKTPLYDTCCYNTPIHDSYCDTTPVQDVCCKNTPVYDICRDNTVVQHTDVGFHGHWHDKMHMQIIECNLFARALIRQLQCKSMSHDCILTSSEFMRITVVGGGAEVWGIDVTAAAAAACALFSALTICRVCAGFPATLSASSSHFYTRNIIEP